MRVLPFLAIPVLTVTLGAQTLADRFRENSRGWEASLEKGDASSVQRSVAALLQKEGLKVSRADYNEMHALVALLDVASRASALDGDWEETLANLQKASSTAAENVSTASGTFTKLRKEHEQKLVEWKAEVEKQEKRLKDLETMPGLTKDQLQQQIQLKSFLEEHRNAIAHSEWSIREIDGILQRLQRDKETYENSLGEWQKFVEKEKQEIKQAGSVRIYAAERLDQLKGDDARPRAERISYGRRLARLDPSNPAYLRFVSELTGDDAPVKPAKTVAPAKKSRKRR